MLFLNTLNSTQNFVNSIMFLEEEFQREHHLQIHLRDQVMTNPEDRITDLDQK